ncbi:MAG TPA: DoxX family protein [Actinomycetota bacterium]
MDIGLLMVRIVIGGLLIGHGTQKLFGWFGGGGVRGTAGFFEALGYRPATPLAVVAGTAEAGGGLLLAAGFLTPLGAAAIAGVMLNAIVTVHLAKGIWNTNGGLEFPLTVATGALAVAFAGPGRFAVDRAVGLDLQGTPWGLAAVALAVGVGSLTLLARSMMAREAEESPDDLRTAA